jgi:processive 1,2-diacylglycerol beta-glucosyltransferase
MKRLLILTTGYGEGHNTAARALRQALLATAGEPNDTAREVGTGVDVRVMDLLPEAHGSRHEPTRKAYQVMINDFPKLWAGFYWLMDRTPVIKVWLPFLRRLRDLLEIRLAEFQPDTVISVYPLYGHLVDRIYKRRLRPFRMYTLVTDSISVSAVWRHKGCDRYFVPNEATAQAMRESGFPNPIEVTGFPVDQRFTLPAPERPALGNGVVARIFYIVNHGHDAAPDVVRALLDIPGLELAIAAGRDEELQKELEMIVADAPVPVRVMGWTSEVPELLRWAHLFICKAGGAVTQETVAAGTPMIITNVVPGQEEGNSQLICNNGCGVIATTAETIAAAVREALAEDAALWKQWAENIAKLSDPAASLRLATRLLEEIPHP